MNNLKVALFPRVNCRLSANEKADGEYITMYNNSGYYSIHIQ